MAEKIEERGAGATYTYLRVDVTPDEHQRFKLAALSRGLTMQELLLLLIKPYILSDAEEEENELQ